MKYIIGLGNPGKKYHYTRHNIAWLIFDTFSLATWKYDKYMNAEFVGENISDDIALYIKPQTFMNRSGEIISSLKKEKDFLSENIILIHDDVDLAFGTIRISYNRGDGGHNGVKSITQYIGTKETIRIRIGVSKLLDDGRLIKPNVLSNFSPEERNYIKNNISPKIEKIVKSLFSHGLEKTMNTFNTK